MATTGLPSAIASAMRQAESLRTVERDVAVAGPEQRVLLFLGVVAVDNPDVAPMANGRAKPLELSERAGRR